VLPPRETVLHAEMSHTHSRDRARIFRLGVVVLGTDTQQFGARHCRIVFTILQERAPRFRPSCDQLAVRPTQR
jgi:hypothetical protein